MPGQTESGLPFEAVYGPQALAGWDPDEHLESLGANADPIWPGPGVGTSSSFNTKGCPNC